MWNKKRKNIFFRFLSRISSKMLIFNILLLFLPIGGILWLDTYEKQLLQAQENTMVQQGRILSAAMSSSDSPDKDLAVNILTSLKGRSEARIRVLDTGGVLLADSSRIFYDIRNEAEPENDVNSRTSSVQRGPSLFYTLVTWPVRIYRKIFYPPNPSLGIEKYYKSDEPLLGPEVRAALAGRYGAITRLTTGGEKSVTLYSAIPIRSSLGVSGVVLVSQSTYRILKDLYEIRMGMFKIFLASLIAATIISLLFSRTIINPLVRLRNEAEAMLDCRGRLTKPFMQMNRTDEIGDLAHSLAELTGRLEKHIHFIEAFARDLSHEFKNPLAAIRSAAEVALDAEKAEDRKRFLNMIAKDVSRMENLLTGAREISLIDTETTSNAPERVNLTELLHHLVTGFRLRKTNLSFNLVLPERTVFVTGIGERLAQVFENLLDNGVSFSPPGGSIDVEVNLKDDLVEVGIRDWGPGVEPQNLDKIFNRFFTFRKAGHRQGHTGLGLAIVKAVVENFSGEVIVENPEGGGALFRVILPRLN